MILLTGLGDVPCGHILALLPLSFFTDRVGGDFCSRLIRPAFGLVDRRQYPIDHGRLILGVVATSTLCANGSAQLAPEFIQMLLPAC